MTVTKELKDFLEQPQNQELLANKDFDSLYKGWTKHWGASILTKFFLDCDIDPFRYIDNIIENSFFGCDWLKEYIVPRNIKCISQSAFSCCPNLTNVQLPKGLVSINWGAFSGCYALSEIIIPDTVQTMSSYAFRECWSIKDITIPNGVSTLSSCLFGECTDLTNVTLPENLKQIEKHAFYYCRGLKNIHFQGTKAQWEQIDKKMDWDKDTPDYVVHCTDGDLKKGDE